MWWRRFRRPALLHVATDTGAGATVVMIHGIASSSVTWQNVVPLLEERHRCILIDLLGFGDSPAPEGAEYTLDEHVAALTRTIKRLRLREPFVLVGHSLGALIATRYAARRGNTLTRLVLVSPPVYLRPSELAQPLDRRVQGFYLEAYKYLREHPEFTLRNAGRVRGMLPVRNALDLNADNWTPFVKSLERTIESQTTISDLAAVSVPIEVVMGDLDEFSSPGAMRIVARLRGVTVTRVPGSAHLIVPRLARAVAAAVESSDTP